MKEELLILSPVDGRVYARLHYANGGEIAQAVSEAQSAFQEWRRTPLDERIARVTAFVSELQKDRTQLAEHVTWQMGRPLQDADEAGYLLEAVDYYAALARDVLVDQPTSASPGIDRFTRRAPLGVHLAICAWNYPVAMVAAIVLPALIAGNTVLFKHAPQTALVSEALNVAAERSGLGTGVFRAIHMTHRDTEQLIGSGDIQSLHFIGSERGGRAVNAASRGAFVDVALELGGKDATYVRADADIDFAAREIATGCFDNSGQSCCSVERIYVHDDVYDRFVEALARAADGWTLGHPVDDTPSIGPVANIQAAERIRLHLRDAEAKGARGILPRSQAFPGEDKGCYISPQIVLEVSQDSLLMQEETFGPVAPVMRVSSDDEALKLMDDTTFGLTAGVWTNDTAVVERFGKHLDVGLFYQNRC
ncbi:MAG: aldehyde dehydrogenase family protein, partial [Pseudomonadota bacterium]